MARLAVVTAPPAARSALAFASLTLALGLALSAARAQDPAPTLRTELGLPPALTDQGRSLAVYPPQSLPLVFSHALHVAGPVVQMDCVDCHDQAPRSTATSDRLLPPMERCLDCHLLGAHASQSASQAEHLREATCDTCHPTYRTQPPILPPELDHVGLDASNFRRVLNPPPRLQLPAANLNFSHARHAQADVACTECHGDMRGIDLASRAQLPTMADCIDCHLERNVAGQSDHIGPEDCATCHPAGRDGRLLTRFDSGILAPTGRFRADDHRPDTFARETHAALAAVDPDACSTCHCEEQCLDCHNGVMKSLALHPPGYAQSHGLDATRRPDECTSCHTVSDFCVGCHEQLGLGDFQRPPLGARFHPEGFVDDPGSAWFHGPQAQRNLVSCTSCHQEETCTPCHAGINPHPPGFDRRCAAMLERNASSCAKCHFDVDALRGICR